MLPYILQCNVRKLHAYLPDLRRRCLEFQPDILALQVSPASPGERRPIGYVELPLRPKPLMGKAVHKLCCLLDQIFRMRHCIFRTCVAAQRNLRGG